MSLKNKEEWMARSKSPDLGENPIVPPLDPAVRALRERLEIAVRGAGGVPTVASRTGIPQSTLYGFLRGAKLPVPAAARIAQATGVRLEWLGSGEEPMRARVLAESAPRFDDSAPADHPAMPTAAQRAEMSAISAEARAQPGATIPPDSIWRKVDFDVLVFALEFVENLDLLGGGQLKNARSRLRRAFNAYDLRKSEKE